MRIVESSCEPLSPTRVRVSVTATFEDLAADLDKAYRTVGERLAVPGFRRGKVPQRIIDQRIGRGAVLQEAVSSYIPGAYVAAIRTHGRRAVGAPEVDITELVDGERLVFTVAVDVRPLFDLPDLDTVTVDVPAIEVDPAEVTDHLDALRSRFATLTPVDRPAAAGDVLILDIVGDLDGEQVPEYSAPEWSYEVGSGGLVPGADEVITGMTDGEVRTLVFTPEQGAHVGTPITLTFTARSVRERVLPAADDDFAALASEFDTIAELRADLARRAESIAAIQRMVTARRSALAAVVALLDLPLPEGTVAAEVERLVAAGADGEAPDPAVLRDRVREELAGEFILDSIAEDAAIEVTPADLTDWVLTNSARYRIPPEQLADRLAASGEMALVAADIRRGKALGALVAQVRLRGPDGEPVELPTLPDAASEHEAPTAAAAASAR